MNKKAFTIAELIIVIAITMILAAAAIGGTRTIIQTLRFNNIFNKTVMMVQEARNLAVTQKSTKPIEYSVAIDFVAIKLKEGRNTTISTTTLAQDSDLSFSFEPNCLSVEIIFAPGTANTELNCIGSTTEHPESLKITLVETDNNEIARQKSFSIHKTAGIPQVE